MLIISILWNVLSRNSNQRRYCNVVYYCNFILLYAEKVYLLNYYNFIGICNTKDDSVGSACVFNLFFFPYIKKRIYYLISALLLICAIICNLTRGKILIPVYNFIEWIFSKIFIVVDYSGYLSRADVGRTFDKRDYSF